MFQPLGITEFSWPANPPGITSGAGGLMLRPLDLAKIGYLHLRGGEWDGKQLVPASWIETATFAQITAGTASDGYGYQWWVDDAGYAMAIGSGGQYVVVAPDHDLVVVFTSGLPPGKDQSPEELTTEYVFEAVVSDHPLPPNPDGQARLAAAVAAAGSGPEPAAAEMPELAASVDGVRYEFCPNAFGNTWFTLSFDETTARFQLQDVDGPIGLAKAGVNPDDLQLAGLENLGRPIDVVVGLDGRFANDELWGLSTAMRGAWATGDTFVIEYQLIGLEARGSIHLRFGADIARMTFLETITRANQTSTAERVG